MHEIAVPAVADCHPGAPSRRARRRPRVRAARHPVAVRRSRRPSPGQRVPSRWHLADRNQPLREAGHRTGDPDLGTRPVRAVQPLLDDLPAHRHPHQGVRTRRRRRRTRLVPVGARGLHPGARGPVLHRAGRARRLHRLRALRRGVPGASDRTQPRRKAINMRPADEHRVAEREAFAFYEQIPDVTRSRIPRTRSGLGLLQPLFEFSGACAGCGETPYIRLLTQLFGDRLLIANATGCSSIYGGNLPTTPYTTDAHGRGPAWNNSLFEDNAEFGLGHAPRRRHPRPTRPGSPRTARPRPSRRPRRRAHSCRAAPATTTPSTARRRAIERLRELLVGIDGGGELADAADALGAAVGVARRR